MMTLHFIIPTSSHSLKSEIETLENIRVLWLQ